VLPVQVTRCAEEAPPSELLLDGAFGDVDVGLTGELAAGVMHTPGIARRFVLIKRVILTISFGLSEL
jgi:hypothetical protein